MELGLLKSLVWAAAGPPALHQPTSLRGESEPAGRFPLPDSDFCCGNSPGSSHATVRLTTLMMIAVCVFTARRR